MSDRFRLHALDERPDDLEVDVGFEQRDPHLAERDLDVVFRESAVATQLVEDALQSCAKGVEHRKLQS